MDYLYTVEEKPGFVACCLKMESPTVGIFFFGLKEVEKDPLWLLKRDVLFNGLKTTNLFPNVMSCCPIEKDFGNGYKRLLIKDLWLLWIIQHLM
ncbi:hypothetical protein TNCT_473501 [Trichonephila clavata]|uniref:Uncharacterized protein n=1 Tax=Trichonephila clavata TaxID=2740835 RepID=A0A8X6LA56_TRICU|nr:hypothetical protein TNCT_473501 [Trichonephila clavata]